MAPRADSLFASQLLTVSELGYKETAIIVLCLLLVYRLGVVVYRLWFHPLSKVPGPPLWAATFMPFVWASGVTATSIFKFAQFHGKYGPMIRIGPNAVVLDGSIGWPQVYQARSGGAAEFPKLPSFWAGGRQHSIIAAPRDVHRRQRRQLAHAFSETAMQEQEGRIVKYVNLLVERVREHADQAKAMNIVQWLNFTTFDIIGDLTFADSFGSLESSNYHPWVLGIFKGIRGDGFARAWRNYPLIGPLLIRIFGGLDVKQAAVNNALAINKIRARVEQGMEPKGQRDFTTYMLRPNRDGEKGMLDQEILHNAPVLVLAGSETTASALSGFFFYLGQTPRAKDILIDEIRSAFQDESEINIKSAARLEYLHATLEETLRVYPPAAGSTPRVSPGAEVNGVYLPQGTIVHVTHWATFRNPDNFREPDAFFPERWLRPTHALHDARFANDNRAAFKPFSAGPRDCIGKNLAYSEMRLIVARLLFNFDFELEPGQEEWHAKQRAFVVWDKGPLQVMFTPRKVAQ